MTLISAISAALPATISHTFHQNHKLSLVTTPRSGMRCDGCKQYGEGPQHYRCEGCNFDLHTQCAAAPDILHHALFVGSTFVLIRNHSSQNGNMTCQACGGDAVGFRYFDKEHNLHLHPCCAVLPMRILQDGRAFQLLKDASATCGICKDKSQSLSYRTCYDDGEQVYLHVPCLVRTNNNLTGNQDWTASAPIMRGMMATFPRKMINGGGGVLQTVGTVFSALNLVYKVVTLDVEGIAESWQNLTMEAGPE